MKSKYSPVILIGLFLGLIQPAWGQDIEDETASLVMKCEYDTANSSSPYESVLVKSAMDDAARPAAIKIFPTASNSKDSTTFAVGVGQSAECIYPSGTQVRVKVGEGVARPYGNCGGSPQVFMSLWVNQRKIASRLWFAGHCIEEIMPDISFKISNRPYPKVSIQKCHIARPPTDQEESRTKSETSTQPLSVCVDFPEITRFPRDATEYSTHPLPKVGTIEILRGTHKVCHAVRRELMADFDTFGQYPNLQVIKLARPDWRPASIDLPEELSESRESIFDFNNDGKLDRVFRKSFESTYIDSSVLLVYDDYSAKGENMNASRSSEPRFFPCQMGTKQYDLNSCPPFSQEGDESGFSMKGATAESDIYFRARYTHLAPFRFENTNFVGVSSQSERTMNYIAVLKPLVKGKFQPMCLLRQVPENF